MAKSNKSKSSTVSAVQYVADTSGRSNDSLSNAIRERAYQLYEARGRQPGSDLDDWLQAEREMRAQLRI